MRTISLPLLLLILFVSVGCDDVGHALGYPFSNMYAMGYMNDTPIVMNHAAGWWLIEGKEYRQSAGHLRPGSDAYFDFSPRPIPEAITARWETSDGAKHEKVVAVRSRLPNGEAFTGTVTFVFTDTNVRLVPIPEWMQIRDTRLGKITRP